MEEVLLNENEYWKAEPHGWYAVANHMSQEKEVSGIARIKSDREEEFKFFTNYEPYAQSKIKYRCGTENLVAKLMSMLGQKMKDRVDGMRVECEKAHQSVKEALALMGQASVFDYDRKCRSEFEAIVNDLHRFFRDAKNGEYGGIKAYAEEVSTEGLKEKLENCELGGKVHERCEKFKSDIFRSRMVTTSDADIKELHKKIIRAKDGRMDPSLTNKSIIANELRANAKKWKALADIMFDDVAQLAKFFLDVVIRVCSAKYKTLPQVLLNYLTSLIDEQKEQALKRLEWYYIDEIFRPTTLVDSFVQSYKNMESGLSANEKQYRNTFKEALNEYLSPTKERFTINAVRTIMIHILDVPLAQREMRFDTESKFIFTSEAIRKDLKLEKLMVLDLHEKHDQMSAKVERLESLHSSLTAISASDSTVENFNVSGKVAAIQH